MSELSKITQNRAAKVVKAERNPKLFLNGFCLTPPGQSSLWNRKGQAKDIGQTKFAGFPRRILPPALRSGAKGAACAATEKERRERKENRTYPNLLNAKV